MKIASKIIIFLNILIFSAIIINFFSSCSKNPLFPIISGEWDYFPLKPGNTQKYIDVDHPSTNYIETMLAEKNFLGKNSIPQEEKTIVNGSEVSIETNTYFIKEDKNLLVGLKDMTNLVSRYLLMAELPPVEGNKWTDTETKKNLDIGVGFLVDFVLIINGEVKEINIEKKVKAGTFKNCAHINITMNAKLINSTNQNNILLNNETLIDSYLAPNIGKIYETTTTKTNGQVESITKKELVSYSVK